MSLAVTAAIVLLLAARMIVLRRATELALRRARGASLLQIGLAAGRGAAVGCVPAAVIAGAVAVLLVPGQAPPGGWWPGLAVLVVAVGAPAVLAALAAAAAPLRSWQGRGRLLPARTDGTEPAQPGLRRARLRQARPAPVPGRGPAGGRGDRGARRDRGNRRVPAAGHPARHRVDLYTSAAPALVAIPAVIVVLRVYPLILRGLLRGAARGRGATGFLGLALAARTSAYPASCRRSRWYWRSPWPPSPEWSATR